MQTHPSDQVVSFRLGSLSTLVADLADCTSIDARTLDIVFAHCPGVEEFVRQVAVYVGNMPSALDPSRRLLDVAVAQALARLAPLGLSPVSVELHSRGFGIFVHVVTHHLQDVSLLDVSNDRGQVWNPWRGPITQVAPVGSTLHAAYASDAPSQIRSTLLRIVILCRCLSFPQLAAVTHSWDEIAPC